MRLTVLLHRRLPDGVEADIIATIKKTFNFSQSDAIHLFQTLMECMKNKELVHLSVHLMFLGGWKRSGQQWR